MKRFILQTALLSTLAASLLCGQTSTTPAAPTPPTPSQVAADIVARLTTLLDLTSSQQTTATSIFTTQATTDQSIQTQMETAHTALQTAITSNSGISTAAAAIGSLTTQQVTADATADAEFYAILTSTQQTKYSTLKLPGLGGLGGPGGGPGGPGGPGGGPGKH